MKRMYTDTPLQVKIVVFCSVAIGSPGRLEDPGGTDGPASEWPDAAPGGRVALATAIRPTAPGPAPRPSAAGSPPRPPDAPTHEPPSPGRPPFAHWPDARG